MKIAKVGSQPGDQLWEMIEKLRREASISKQDLDYIIGEKVSYLSVVRAIMSDTKTKSGKKRIALLIAKLCVVYGVNRSYLSGVPGQRHAVTGEELKDLSAGELLLVLKTVLRRDFTKQSPKTFKMHDKRAIAIKCVADDITDARVTARFQKD